MKDFNQMKINFLTAIPVFVFSLLTFSSCTQEVDLHVNADPKIVVEGNIENGLPPIISLTSTVPFYGEINFNDLDGYFVHDAEVSISDGITTTALVEFCLSEIPEEFKPLVAEYLGIELDSTGNFPVEVCLYTVSDILAANPAFVGEAGKTYTLTINANGETLTSSTMLLPPVPTDSIYIKPHDDPENDSLVRLYVHLTEPPVLGNYYRYFTKRNSEAYYAGYSSVFDDNIVNGESFEFTVDRGFYPTEDFDPEVYGYFWRGDTVILKWCSIDFPTFDFWRTLEFDSGTDGPFSSATIAQTNINGGLGIWCGYGAAYDTIIVPLE